MFMHNLKMYLKSLQHVHCLHMMARVLKTKKKTSIASPPNRTLSINANAVVVCNTLYSFKDLPLQHAYIHTLVTIKIFCRKDRKHATIVHLYICVNEQEKRNN